MASIIKCECGRRVPYVRTRYLGESRDNAVTALDNAGWHYERGRTDGKDGDVIGLFGSAKVINARCPACYRADIAETARRLLAGRGHWARRMADAV